MVRPRKPPQGDAARRRVREAGRRRHQRLARTLLLGTLALAAALYWLGDQLALDWQELGRYLLFSALGVGLLIAAALLLGSLIGWIRTRRRQ